MRGHGVYRRGHFTRCTVWRGQVRRAVRRLSVWLGRRQVAPPPRPVVPDLSAPVWLAGLADLVAVAAVLQVGGLHAPGGLLWTWCGAALALALVAMFRRPRPVGWRVARWCLIGMALLVLLPCLGITGQLALLVLALAAAAADPPRRSRVMVPAGAALVVAAMVGLGLMEPHPAPSMPTPAAVVVPARPAERPASGVAPVTTPTASTGVAVLLQAGALGVRGRRRRQSQRVLRQAAVVLEQAVAHERAAAEGARRAAEAAVRDRTRFFQAASHDLRQPLQALSLLAGTLQRQRHDCHSAALVTQVVASVDALDGLFSEMLDLTRIDSEGLSLREDVWSVAALFEPLRADLALLAKAKQLDLRIAGGHLRVRTDPELMQRVLRNLIGNAIRYTERGGVLLSARARGQQVLLQVWDTGVGIRAESLSRIFDEFYQVDGRRMLLPHHRMGLGLGLAIVRRLADALQLGLTVRSQPHRGTVFSMLLSAAPAEDRVDVSASGPQVPATAAAGYDPRSVADQPGPLALLAGRAAVVVDDDEGVLLALRLLLEDWGVEVVGFASYEAAALWAAQGGLECPGVLIIDQHLPHGQQGSELVALLRARFGAPVPALITSGRLPPRLLRQAEIVRAQVLRKPVRSQRLAQAIGQVLQAGAATRPTAGGSTRPPAYNRRPL